MSFIGLFRKRDLRFWFSTAYPTCSDSFQSSKPKLVNLCSLKRGKRDMLSVKRRQKRPTSFSFELCKGLWKMWLQIGLAEKKVPRTHISRWPFLYTIQGYGVALVSRIDKISGFSFQKSPIIRVKEPYNKKKSPYIRAKEPYNKQKSPIHFLQNISMI